MIPVTPSAIQTSWRRSTSPMGSGVLTSLTTTMPRIASVPTRSISRAGCSIAGISAPSALSDRDSRSGRRGSCPCSLNASHPVVAVAVVTRAQPREELLDRALHVADPRPPRASAPASRRTTAARAPRQAERGVEDEEAFERKPMVRMAGGSLSARASRSASAQSDSWVPTRAWHSLVKSASSPCFGVLFHRVIPAWHSPTRSAKNSGKPLSGGHSNEAQALGDRLIVKAVEEEETTASGLVLPDTAKEKPQKGKVLAVGDGEVDEDTASASRSTSPRATRSSTRSTAAPRSRSTARTCWSCARPTCSPRSRASRERETQEWHTRNSSTTSRRVRPSRPASTPSPTRSRSRLAPGALRRPRQEVRRPDHHERRRDHRS